LRAPNRSTSRAAGRSCLQSHRKGAVSERKEAVAGRSCDDGPASRSGSAAVLEQVAALAHRIIDVEEAIVLALLAELAAGALAERDRRERAEAIVDAWVDVLARAVDMRDD
jgi:hypothetical protein